MAQNHRQTGLNHRPGACSSTPTEVAAGAGSRGQCWTPSPFSWWHSFPQGTLGKLWLLRSAGKLNLGDVLRTKDAGTEDGDRSTETAV